MAAPDTTLELVLLVAGSLGVVFSTRAALRMMRSRAAIAIKSQRK
jgi:hypothetical protein